MTKKDDQQLTRRKKEVLRRNTDDQEGRPAANQTTKNPVVFRTGGLMFFTN